MKVASGGELSRFLLALKVVLSTAARRPRWCSTKSIPVSAAPVADAIGARLSRLAGQVR